MAIVEMRRLRLLGMRTDRDALLRLLQRLGCVEVSEPAVDLTDPVWVALSRSDGQALAGARERSKLFATALEILNEYKKPPGALHRPKLSEAQLFDEGAYQEGIRLAQTILDGQRQAAALAAERDRLQGQSASLTPWLMLDVPLETEGTETVSVIFAAVPAGADYAAMEGAVGEVTELACLYDAGADRERHCFLLLCHKTAELSCVEVMEGFGFSPVDLRGWTGSAADNVRWLDSRLAAMEAEMEGAKAAVAACNARRELLLCCGARAEAEAARKEAEGRLLDTDTAFFLTGWIPADEEGRLAELLEQYPCAWETEEPAAEDYPRVPVELKNNRMTRPLSMVTDMYSLPAYGSLDPNPLMAPFFIFFYGFMMADMGYGLLMMLASLIILKRVDLNGAILRHMIPLLGLCGVSAFVMGAVTGSFFGDLIPQWVRLTSGREIGLPALFSPLDDALAVLIGSLAIGAVQIFTGMAINLYKRIRRGEVLAALCGEGAWFAVFLLFAAGLLLGRLKIAAIAIGAILVLTQGYGKKGVVGKIVGIGGSLYNHITGYFSDILSYSRLMALMLAGAVIAQVFNTLGAITGNVLTFLLISAIGNGLNFALSLLGCFVHDMRLQCLEFFGRFYEDGGKPFRPLAFGAKYADIEKGHF